MFLVVLQEGTMALSLYQEKFNDSIVAALLFSNLSMDDKESKLQAFINETDERYDMLCDNITRLLVNKETNNDVNTLFLTIDGFSFISNSALNQQPSCVPVLTINQYSPNCPDILAYVEIALGVFSSYCSFIKTTFQSTNKSA